MKNTEDLTMKEMQQVFAVLMDSKLQNELMEKIEKGDNKGENVWMLDYVYDSSLRKKLEAFYEVAVMREELSNKNKAQTNHKVKI